MKNVHKKQNVKKNKGIFKKKFKIFFSKMKGDVNFPKIMCRANLEEQCDGVSEGVSDKTYSREALLLEQQRK